MNKFLQLPIGYDNFGKIIAKKLDFVDKTLFIKAILDNVASEVIIITRPRRFGKTLNLSMLHYFLASEAYGQHTHGMFDALHIAKCCDDYMRHQGQYPVIMLTLKNVSDHNFINAIDKLRQLCSALYAEYTYLLHSDKLLESDKKSFNDILDKTGSQALLENALASLTRYLTQHHNVKPWLLIDEYDTPLQAAYLHGYYTQMISCIRNLLGSVLKTNPYLERAVITGILRVSKESLFSGLNNVNMYTVLHADFGEYFGFTSYEVQCLLHQSHLTQHAPLIREWYNGYHAGTVVIYNPWSIVNCITNNGEIRPYWVNSSDNQLIRDLLVQSSGKFKADFELLLAGGTVHKFIDENIVVADSPKNETAVWSFLLMTGYLTVTATRHDFQGLWCTLAIPNHEVGSLYQQIIEHWLSKQLN